jgi:hypothetical protein
MRWLTLFLRLVSPDCPAKAKMVETGDLIRSERCGVARFAMEHETLAMHPASATVRGPHRCDNCSTDMSATWPDARERPPFSWFPTGQY